MAGEKAATESVPPPVAVIDVGTTAIRMAVAQQQPDGSTRTLDVLNRPLALGKDTFYKGTIGRDTIEDCVGVLKSYRQILDEYGVRVPEDVRAVGTSAVREASNCQMLIDRVYIATGIRVEPIDEAGVNRLTYLSVHPFFAAHPELTKGNTLIVEVGAGTTEILLLQDGDVVASHSYRLGALRLQQLLANYQMPGSDKRLIIEKQIQRMVDQIRVGMKGNAVDRMVTLGGDMRFVADHLASGWREKAVAKLPVKTMEPFARELLKRSADELVRDYRLSFQDAETVGPAVYAIVKMARAFKRNTLWISKASLRDGLLTELQSGGAWTEDFRQQIHRSALELGRKYDFHEAHAQHAADLSMVLCRALQGDHQLDARHEDLLYTAALLHEIGLYVSNRSHHKHSMYLILNSDLFGLSSKDLLMVALVARYHRRAQPRSTHEGYQRLESEGRIAVTQMAAILRVADALERSHSQRIRDIRCSREKDRFVIRVPSIGDFSLEQVALQQKGALFEDVFGLKIHLQRGGRRTK